jgi:hypothetical protein
MPAAHLAAADTGCESLGCKSSMKNNKDFHRGCMRIALSLLLLFVIPLSARPQAQPDFSGIWKQDNDRCQPKRSGEVTLRIEHHGPELKVETSILRGAQTPRRALQRYTTDGKVSVSTGADGDKFHTSAIWKGSELVFSIEEHEDGHILLSKETWSLIEDGATLRRIRERPDGERQTLLYRREPAT